MAAAPFGEHRGFQHCPCPLCTGGWRWSRSAHHPGGKTLAGWHESGEVIIPKVIHLVFLPPYSPELQQMSNDCGRSPMKRLPIVVSRLSTNYKSRKLKGVLPFRTIRSVFSSTRSSIGGLSVLGDLLSLVGYHLLPLSTLWSYQTYGRCRPMTHSSTRSSHSRMRAWHSPSCSIFTKCPARSSTAYVALG